MQRKVIGIVLAICSGLFIGVSFVLKKVGLLRANAKYNEEAGEGYGYLKNAYWWSGMTLMIIGELCNFVAYAFADAILVTPLGALSVVITTILSAIFLKERLSFVGKISCVICILGSVIIVLNAPQQPAVSSIQEMQRFVITAGFLSYAGVIIVGCVCVAFFVAPKYGKKSMLVYLTICSLIGGLSVTCIQGLGAAIIAQANGKPQFNQWFLYVLFVFVIGTLVTEIIFLNKALNIFNAALVTPTYYVYFTSATIVTSAVLFQGFHGSATQIVDVVLGFLVICGGVVLLQLAKSSKDVPDAAVLKGDLDQVRTIAEQEEPESEPRADTIRAGAGIVRAISRVRTIRQAKEVERIQEERMMPLNEGEFVWDGLRRRPTVSTVHSGSVRRNKSIHPPLGMSHFPDDISEPDSEVHPGFFGRIGKRSQRRGTQISQPTVQLGELSSGALPSSTKDGTVDVDEMRPYDLPPPEETAYRPQTSTSTGAHIHFAEDPRSRASSHTSSLAPPQPPPHSAGGTRRQFSFTNVFHRHRSDSQNETLDAHGRPVSRGALSFTSQNSGTGHRAYPASAGAGATEEERLGLVQGDSSRDTTTSKMHGGRGEDSGMYDRLSEEPEEDLDMGVRHGRGELDDDADEDDWHMTRAESSSPEQIHSPPGRI